MIGLDSYSRQVFIYLDPILIYSVFESTAYLKFAKLQHVSSGFRCRECRVTDEALLAETT